ncbi:MAG TPA: hypothetical protein VKU00_12110 [Chthonomonadaceae bacterium]|nr:hypothetical protein [Chthonomonadaceae bacterium]
MGAKHPVDTWGGIYNGEECGDRGDGGFAALNSPTSFRQGNDG